MRKRTGIRLAMLEAKSRRDKIAKVMTTGAGIIFAFGIIAQ